MNAEVQIAQDTHGFYFIRIEDAEGAKEVRLVERSGRNDWMVERTKGASKGKRMICPERALVDSLSN
jgi:hypothetical protein